MTSKFKSKTNSGLLCGRWQIGFSPTKLLFIVMLLLSNACQTSSDQVITELPDYWVVLEVSDAIKSDSLLTWEFDLERPGKYDVQIVSNSLVNHRLPKLKMEIEGITVDEVPDKIVVLDSLHAPKTVFQYGRFVALKNTGKQTISIESNPFIDQIRITPDYRGNIGFGSDKYYQDWLTMHQSPPKQEALAWLKEAKYGMFIHWGLYSQAGGVWKGKRINDTPYPGPKVAEWLMHAFRIPRAEYATLANNFNPDKSFAQNIAKLAKDAGMKYVVITSKHHDGFALFDSKYSEYDMVDATPYKADAIKELYDACLKEGIKFGIYYSHGNDWYDGADGRYAATKKRNDSLGVQTHANGKNLWDPSQNSQAEYIETKALNQVKELVAMFPELAMVWFDGDGYITEDQSFEFYKMVYDLNPKVLVNRRVGFDFGDYLDAGDNVIPSASDKLTKYWETCGTTNNSWGFKSYDTDWKSTPELLYYLIDIASKGGNYLLNIGPDGKGHVPEASANGLREVGDWLVVNGEAIYGSTRWKIQSEGKDETLLEGTGHREVKGFKRQFSNEDFWFTSKENTVYIISLVAMPKEVLIKSLKSEGVRVTQVSLLGSDSALTWEQNSEVLYVELPELKKDAIGFVLKATLATN